MKVLKRIWNYFFPRKVEFPPIYIQRNEKEELKEIRFFEPVTPLDKFQRSKDLADFIKKID